MPAMPPRVAVHTRSGRGSVPGAGSGVDAARLPRGSIVLLGDRHHLLQRSRSRIRAGMPPRTRRTARNRWNRARIVAAGARAGVGSDVRPPGPARPRCRRRVRARPGARGAGAAQDVVDLGEQFLEVGIQREQLRIEPQGLRGTGTSRCGHHLTPVVAVRQTRDQALMAWRSGSARVISILRGLAFSATGIDRRSTPSR